VPAQSAPARDASAGRPEVAAQAGPEHQAPAGHPEAPAEVPRRRRQVTSHRGRATVADAPTGSFPTHGTPARVTATGSATTGDTSYSGVPASPTESAPPRPLNPDGTPGPRVLIDHVQVSTAGLEAQVEVGLAAGTRHATGLATGPAVDGYLLRLCAVSAAVAIDELLQMAEQVTDPGRCFVEHAVVVSLGSCEVATVVLLLVCDGWVEQLAGSALVAGDPREAVVRATLAAVNRRLEALLA
jgi:hypothetical protein